MLYNNVRPTHELTLRLAYKLVSKTFLIKYPRMQLLLPYTTNCGKFLSLREEKRKDIWPEFYMMYAIMNRQWTGRNHKQHHTITRLAVHGFLHKVCKNNYFHQSNDTCKNQSLATVKKSIIFINTLSFIFAIIT